MSATPIAIIRRKAIIKRFINAGALTPSSAKTPEEVGSFKGLGLIYSRLIKKGILIQIENNKYYVDVNKLRRKWSYVKN